MIEPRNVTRVVVDVLDKTEGNTIQLVTEEYRGSTTGVREYGTPEGISVNVRAPQGSPRMEYCLTNLNSEDGKTAVRESAGS